MKKKEKRRAGRPKDEMSLNTNEILRIALKNFAEKGFGGVTLKSLADQTGVADSLLHYHFGNKEELWKKSMHLVGQEIYRELNNLFLLIDDMDGLEKLRLFNKKIVHVSAQYPEFQQCVVQAVFSDNERSSWLIEELLRPIFKFMENIIEEEQEKGRIKKIPQPHISSFIIGSITTFFSRSYQMKKAYNIDSFAQDQVDAHVDAINDLLFNGLLNSE